MFKPFFSGATVFQPLAQGDTRVTQDERTFKDKVFFEEDVYLSGKASFYTGLDDTPRFKMQGRELAAGENGITWAITDLEWQYDSINYFQVNPYLRFEYNDVSNEKSYMTLYPGANAQGGLTVWLRLSEAGDVTDSQTALILNQQPSQAGSPDKVFSNAFAISWDSNTTLVSIVNTEHATADPIIIAQTGTGGSATTKFAFYDTKVNFVEDYDIEVAGTKRLSLNRYGLMVDQTNGALPGYKYESLGDLTTISASTFTSIDTANRPVILHGAHTNKVRVRASGHASATITTTADLRARMRISTDSGSTWTNGKGTRFHGAADETSLFCALGVEATPTGNLVAELQVWSTQTDTDFTNNYAEIMAFGDI